MEQRPFQRIDGHHLMRVVLGHTGAQAAIAVENRTVFHGLEHVVRALPVYIKSKRVRLDIAEILFRIVYRQADRAAAAAERKQRRKRRVNALDLGQNHRPVFASLVGILPVAAQRHESGNFYARCDAVLPRRQPDRPAACGGAFVERRLDRRSRILLSGRVGAETRRGRNDVGDDDVVGLKARLHDAGRRRLRIGRRVADGPRLGRSPVLFRIHRLIPRFISSARAQQHRQRQQRRAYSFYPRRNPFPLRHTDTLLRSAPPMRRRFFSLAVLYLIHWFP